MDYLQSLEFRMAALQRKIRLLQDLRFFAETASPEELAGFGDELRAVLTSGGVSLGSILASLLGASASEARSLPSRVARSAPTMPPMPPIVEPPPAVQGEDVPAEGSSAAGNEKEQALALLEPSMKPIPAGSFAMGSEAVDSEKPQHTVALGAYRLCDHLVTNKEYALFIAAKPQWSKDRAELELRDEHYLEDWGEGGYPEGKEEHPVAFVSFYAAEACAAWLGKRLPSEAEWERGARGGLAGKKYPGGDTMNDKLANLAKQFRGTTPARQFEPNGFGLYDMAGNLFEWCSDWYGPYVAGSANDPKGPPSGEYKVVRGGSWMSGAGALRVSARVDMEPRSCGQVGIRLADGG
jgi:formylglycine-generating enzyme required for sulfatase activity